MKLNPTGNSIDRRSVVLQKTKIPARGLKRTFRPYFLPRRVFIMLQKTKIPARGLKPTSRPSLFAAKEIIKLQKTKIPARGLKPESDWGGRAGPPAPSKNQNPREGIETCSNGLQLALNALLASKNQNPREGIETSALPWLRPADAPSPLQKTKIPARGLKLAMKQA